MTLSDEMKDIMISVGNKSLDVSVAIDRMKKLKEQYHIPLGKGKKYDTEFCEAYIKAVKGIPHEERFADTPFDEMSDLGKGLELINNVLLYPNGKTWRMRKEELRKERE